ncbi:MAG: hypothetical protein VCD33_16480 [Alphaproteobacteria bacterium]
MRMVMALAGLVLFAASPALAQQGQLIGTWDLFDDGCRSGYLEYTADGRFHQVYRRDHGTWINDLVWGNGTYRLDGDLLFSSEEKLDGSVRIQTKEQISFSSPNRLDVTFIDIIWVDNRSNEVRPIDGFEESWTRCPAGATDSVSPLQVATHSDVDTLAGRWGWVQGCGTGYVEYTDDGRIWLTEIDDAGDAVMDPEFDYGIYEIKGDTLLEVYGYRSGTWTSETNFAFDDRGLLFFSDSLKTSWTETGGGTNQDDPFFEVLFRCVAEDIDDASGEAAGVPDTSEAALEEFLFDSDVALLVAAVRESWARCGGVYASVEAGGDGSTPTPTADAVADCIDYFWSFMDVSGDGLMSLSEIARGMRLFTKWSTAEQAKANGGSVDPETKIGIHVIAILIAPIGAKPVLESYDYDNDGLLSQAEMFADTDLAGVVKLSQQPVADIIDIDGIMMKLQAIIGMMMQ